jgi:hypothetical protein
MNGRTTFASFSRSLLLAGVALALFAAPLATPARALSQLQPAPTAEEAKKPAKPGAPGGSGGSGVDEGDDAGGAQPAPPAGEKPAKPAAPGGGADEGDDGDGAQPAPPADGKPAVPPAGGNQPTPPPAGGGDDGDDGGAQPAPPADNKPAPPAGGDQPAVPPAGGGGDGGDDGGDAGPSQPGTPPAPPPDGGNGGGGDEANDPARPPTDENGPAPEVLYDLATLPQPVKRMRELIMEACKSGDLEKLRPLIGTGDSATRLSFDDSGDDPIDVLKQSSGDEGGQEILAILLEVLEAGFVHLDAGTDQELYVWPYFFAVPLDKLGAPQRVELFKLITAGDYEDMKGYGAYIFYRVGITPEGKWEFFIAGD